MRSPTDGYALAGGARWDSGEAQVTDREEFAEVLGEEVDVPGLKRAIEAPRPADEPLAEGEESAQGTLFDEPGEGATPGEAAPSAKDDETRSE